MVDQPSRQDLIQALREYIDLDMPIIPLCSHDHKGYSPRHQKQCSQAGKIPLIKGWATHAKTTKEQVNNWLREFKNINIGMPLGHISGYVGIDVDGIGGEEMLDELSQGDLPETWEFATGDGRRLLYELPVGLQTKKYVNQDDSREHTECSILAFGQQTVMPPSIHHTGRVYEWSEGLSPDDIDCAMAPDWLIDLVRDDDPRSRMKPGSIDLTSENPTYEAPEPDTTGIEVAPLLVTEDSLALEFTDPVQEISYDVPKSDYKGKKAKTQEEKKQGMSAEDLTQILTSGTRDTGMTKVIGHFCALHRSMGKDYIMHMAKAHNMTFCQPPLDDLSIETKVNYFWEAEEMKSAKYKEKAKQGRMEREEFIPLERAQVVLNLLEDQGMVVKISPNEPVLWMTHKEYGPWKPIHIGGNAEAFQIYMLDALTKEEYGGNGVWGTRKNFGEVANSIALLLKQQGRVWTVDTNDTNTQSLEGHDYIPLKDGKLLEWRTGELHTWKPETHLTYIVPVDYNPKATCPNWEKRLAQWLPDADVRKVVQEFVGYSFIPYMGFEKALLIQGEGANGKSMFLETLQKMLGKDITTSATMSVLFSRFGKTPLIGKILNIVNEAGADYLKGPNADDFKNMVSGGAVMADIKNKDPMTFNNTAKFIFSANHDIKTSDKSVAWIRRMLLIPFEQDFTGSKETKHEIMDEFVNEYPGIFNWAVEGLKRLMENKGFTESAHLNQRMDEYMRKNDIAADFAQHCLSREPLFTVDGQPIERGVACSAVTELFKMWAQYRGSDLKKHADRLKEHMEKKKIKSARKAAKYLTMSDATKTACWMHIKIDVKDPDFIEWLIETGELAMMSSHKLKMYLDQRLKELNDDNSPEPPPTTSRELAPTAP